MGETTKPLLHRAVLTKGCLVNDVAIATCGARRDQGAKFTTNSRQVSCPGCRSKMNEQRAAAKARFAALGLG
jgi:hypothetical protein